MTIKDFEAAINKDWIDPQLVENMGDVDTYHLDTYDVVYLLGKGGKMVPILIPNDTRKPMETLLEQRITADIPENNHFLFPNTGFSMDHVNGYSAVKAIINMVADLEKPKLLIADKFRHRASTLFAILDIPEQNRETFYRHMGHSAEINKTIYQCPTAIREVTEVGYFLNSMNNLLCCSLYI